MTVGFWHSHILALYEEREAEMGIFEAHRLAVYLPGRNSKVKVNCCHSLQFAVFVSWLITAERFCDGQSLAVGAIASIQPVSGHKVAYKVRVMAARNVGGDGDVVS
ncbi:hypothetical protein RRG08_059299 [Elysia crispata]|uniref:Uncharacterized protein n=1 Tax=Elysia crispata TaxID=231223 RepID=A0AAE0ZD20_9GAST|nr:hypothetical protein RRG08_059299 [Elysia crispata]